MPRLRHWGIAGSLALFWMSAVSGTGAAEFEARFVGGSVQLGGELRVEVVGRDAPLPDGARCEVAVDPPYDAHLTVVSEDCTQMVLKQANTPILDQGGAVLPAGEVAYVIRVVGPGGEALGEVPGRLLYNNQFSDIRILIRDVQNPVSEGERFEAVVLGAGQPIDPALLCRWNLYGPVKFEPTSKNRCEGILTALAPTGRDADMDVGIFNLSDMFAVGYATAKMLVE